MSVARGCRTWRQDAEEVRRSSTRDGAAPQGRSERAEEGSDEESDDEHVQPNIAVAPDGAEGDETPIARDGARHDAPRLSSEEDPERLRNVGVEPLRRLLLLSGWRRSLCRTVTIVMLAAHEIRGQVAQWESSVDEAVKRQHTATEDEDCRRDERDRGPEHPYGCDQRALSHRWEAVMQIVVRNRRSPGNVPDPGVRLRNIELRLPACPRYHPANPQEQSS